MVVKKRKIGVRSIGSLSYSLGFLTILLIKILTGDVLM